LFDYRFPQSKKLTLSLYYRKRTGNTCVFT